MKWRIYVENLLFSDLADDEFKEYFLGKCKKWNIEVRAERAEEVKQA